MEHSPPKPMTPFDELVISPDLQILKLLLPYTPPDQQEFLGVFIKIFELKETVRFFVNARNNLLPSTGWNYAASSNTEIINALKPYISPSKIEVLNTFSSLLTALETGENLSPIEIMMGMLTPDQQNMYEMYSEMFENEMKGNNRNE